jgi:hypothetical protein
MMGIKDCKKEQEDWREKVWGDEGREFVIPAALDGVLFDGRSGWT